MERMHPGPAGTLIHMEGILVIFRKLGTLLRSPRKAITSKIRPLIYWQATLTTIRKKKAREFLHSEGILDLLVQGAEGEHPPDFNKLKLLYDAIRLDKSNVVLEFGSGFSTIVMAAALEKNASEGAYQYEVYPKLYSVEGNEKWMENTVRKIPEHLKKYCVFSFSPPRATTVNGELCCRHDRLPSIMPSLIYLDGPSPYDVKGDVNGLNFRDGIVEGAGYNRTIIAADLLLYEGSLSGNARIIVDSESDPVSLDTELS